MRAKNKVTKVLHVWHAVVVDAWIWNAAGRGAETDC
jgi:hypothetical protein